MFIARGAGVGGEGGVHRSLCARDREQSMTRINDLDEMAGREDAERHIAGVVSTCGVVSFRHVQASGRLGGGGDLSHLFYRPMHELQRTPSPRRAAQSSGITMTGPVLEGRRCVSAVSP